MATKPAPHFIVIDDDPFNNMLCEMLITSSSILSSATIQSFTIPEEALTHIKDNYVHQHRPTVLLLDINMPTMTGWEFLDCFDELDAAVRKQFKIYILSSSVDQRDKELAWQNKNIIDYIVKPLTVETVNAIVKNFY